MENQSGKPLRKSKAPPVIRQTRTSAFRIIRSNPLLMYDTDSVQKMGIKDTKTVPKSVDVLGISSRNNNTAQIRSANITNSNSLHQIPSRNNNLCNKEEAKPKTKPLNNVHRRLPNMINNKNTVMVKKKNLDDKKVVKATVRQSISSMYRERLNHPKRRSKSAEKFDPNKCIKKSTFEEIDSKLERTRSLADLEELSLLEGHISPIREKPKITFKTPLAHNRRSLVYCTPSSGRKTLYRQFSSTPAPVDLQKRLNDWLTRRGKSLGTFHHLKCFGLHESKSEASKISNNNDENKENEHSESNLKGKVDDIDSIASNNVNFECVARDALDDLHKLIQDGYPLDQCELWLSRIRHHYHDLEEEPLYWECRAALEQCRGNISTAVEHYRKAIIKGAEVNVIEDSLEQLLQKFSLLNINPEMSEAESKNRRVISDARNVFKSTIIQFAVQERMLKKKEEQQKREIIVTPVRRSTRLSMKHTTNSSVKVCASIKEIDMNENTRFQTNSFLSIRFNS